MTFDVLQSSRTHLVVVRTPHRLNLTFTQRSPQALALPVRSHGQTADHAQNRIAVRQGPVERLQDDGRIPVGTDQPVRIAVERPRARRADGLSLRKQHQPEPFRKRTASRNRHVQITALQRVHRLGHTDQR